MWSGCLGVNSCTVIGHLRFLFLGKSANQISAAITRLYFPWVPCCFAQCLSHCTNNAGSCHNSCCLSLGCRMLWFWWGRKGLKFEWFYLLYSCLWFHRSSHRSVETCPVSSWIRYHRALVRFISIQMSLPPPDWLGVSRLALWWCGHSSWLKSQSWLDGSTLFNSKSHHLLNYTLFCTDNNPARIRTTEQRENTYSTRQNTAQGSVKLLQCTTPSP